MDPLVSASLLARRAARAGHGVAICLVLGAGVVVGYGSGVAPRSGAPLALVREVSIVAAVVWAWRLVSRLRRKLGRTGEAPFTLDLEIGMLLAVGLDALLLRWDGGLSGTLSPAAYALVALVAAFSRPAAGLIVVLWVVLLEAAIRRYALNETAAGPLA